MILLGPRRVLGLSRDLSSCLYTSQESMAYFTKRENPSRHPSRNKCLTKQALDGPESEEPSEDSLKSRGRQKHEDGALRDRSIDTARHSER